MSNKSNLASVRFWSRRCFGCAPDGSQSYPHNHPPVKGLTLAHPTGSDVLRSVAAVPTSKGSPLLLDVTYGGRKTSFRLWREGARLFAEGDRPVARTAGEPSFVAAWVAWRCFVPAAIVGDSAAKA